MSLMDFDAARKERDREREPLQFKLGGETFTCLATIPIGYGFDLVAADESGNTTKKALAFQKFVLSVLATDDDRTRFGNILRSSDDPITDVDLVELVQWISEEYTGRPTKRSSDSSDGPPANGRSSKPAKSARARKASKPSTSES